VTPPIRLLAIDIDGTLLDAKSQVPEANLAALRRAYAGGIEIVLTTGRRHSFALPIAESLGFGLWLISSNGAITKSIGGEVFHRDLLPSAVARRLVDHMRPFQRHAVLTFDQETRGALVLESAEELHASIARWMEKNAEFIERVGDLEQALSTDPIQVMYCGRIDRMRQAESHLLSGSIAGEVTLLKTEYEARNLCILDVMNRDCSKGHALKRWAKHRGITRQQIVAIGDNYNDIEMLEFAGIPVIMENASPQLKRSGWRVTLSNEQSGVAAALQELGI